MGKMLTKSDIQAVNDHKREEVHVPEWGGSLFVRTLSGQERDAFEASQMGAKGDAKLQDIRARFVVACACDEKGEALFEAKDVAWLTLKSSSALSRVFNVASKLNAMTEADVEDLAKN